MLKKLILGGTIVAVGATALLGTSAYSYMRSGVHSLRQGIKSQIPVEVELSRARDMIRDIKPEIAENLRKIASEEVEVSRLEKELDRKKIHLTKSRSDILRMKEDLTAGGKKLIYSGREYSAEAVREDLTHRFKQFQTQEATSSKVEKILEARQRNLDAARRKLDEMLAAKRQLEIEVENLQARLTMVQVAETTSHVVVGDSQLSQTRGLLDEIASRIDVAEKMVESESVLEGSIPIDEINDESIVDQITNYFDGNHDSAIAGL